MFLVGVDGLKALTLSRLSAGRSIRFSNTLEVRFYEELTSERRVIRYVKGVPVRRFERIPGRRAECLDAFVYALAARHLVGVNLDRRETELAARTMLAAPPTVIKSAWLERS